MAAEALDIHGDPLRLAIVTGERKSGFQNLEMLSGKLISSWRSQKPTRDPADFERKCAYQL